ncbi:MAG TPA: hypothetical protein VK071_03270, partial [Tissierellales bacterium]|nr:hypothetical protein [Tissierellales bacterium]
MKNKKIILMIILLISVVLTACSVESHERGDNGNENIKEKDVNASNKEDTNQEENKNDKKVNNMEPYSIVIDKVQNKATKPVGDIVFDEGFDGICEITGSDSDLISISIDENKRTIDITSDKRYLDTGGDLVIKLGVP